MVLIALDFGLIVHMLTVTDEVRHHKTIGRPRMISKSVSCIFGYRYRLKVAAVVILIQGRK